MSGRIAVAPCGHTGETIIGTYVKCLVGCEGPAVQNARGEPGHVLNCACGSCRIRRKATHVVYRTRDGKDFVKLEWDGVTDKFRFVTEKSGWISGYRFLDGDGKTIAEGRIADSFGEPVYVEAGIPMIGQAKFMLRDAGVTMSLEGTGFKVFCKKTERTGHGTSFCKGAVAYCDGLDDISDYSKWLKLTASNSATGYFFNGDYFEYDRGTK